MMRRKGYVMKLVVLVLIIFFIITVSYIKSSNYELILPITTSERIIVRSFIFYSFNPHVNISALTPAVVNAIIWDFRGLDTLFETIVFFTSIVAALSLYHELIGARYFEVKKFSLIVTTMVKVLTVLTLVAGASIALRGHLSPGGGFQGGGILAVLMFIAATTLSLHYIELKGIKFHKLITLRSLALLALLVMIFLPFLLGLLRGVKGYLFQNQYKSGAIQGINYFLAETPITGILLFNIFEMIIVASGFSIILYILTVAGFEKETRVGG